MNVVCPHFSGLVAEIVHGLFDQFLIGWPRSLERAAAVAADLSKVFAAPLSRRRAFGSHDIGGLGIQLGGSTSQHYQRGLKYKGQSIGGHAPSWPSGALERPLANAVGLSGGLGHRQSRGARRNLVEIHAIERFYHVAGALARREAFSGRSAATDRAADLWPPPAPRSARSAHCPKRVLPEARTARSTAKPLETQSTRRWRSHYNFFTSMDLARGMWRRSSGPRLVIRASGHIVVFW